MSKSKYYIYRHMLLHLSQNFIPMYQVFYAIKVAFRWSLGDFSGLELEGLEDAVRCLKLGEG